VDIEVLASEGTAWQPIVHKMMIDTGAQVTILEEPYFVSRCKLTLSMNTEVEGTRWLPRHAH
jgi:hypothetical protein